MIRRAKRRWLIIIIAACVALLLAIVGIPTIANRRYRDEVQAKQQALTETLDNAIASAESAELAFDFDAALRTLKLVEDDIFGKYYFEVEDRYWAEVAGIKERQRQHDAKLAKGWAMFEGRFISPEEKASIVSERERAEKKRLAEAKEAERLRQKLAKQLEDELEKKLKERFKDTQDFDGGFITYAGGDDLRYAVSVLSFSPGSYVADNDIKLMVYIENEGSIPRMINPFELVLGDESGAIYAVNTARVSTEDVYGPFVLNPGLDCLVFLGYEVPKKKSFLFPIPGADIFFVIDGED